MADRPRLIVADSSALIALANCGALAWLDSLVENLRVPPAVFQEVTLPDKPHSAALRTYLRDKVEGIELRELIIEVGSLGQGELEAMALYRKLGADALLLDDGRARRVARLNGTQVIGSLGLLVLAKQQGVIDEIAPLIAQLRNGSIYFRDDLLRRVLALAQEGPTD